MARHIPGAVDDRSFRAVITRTYPPNTLRDEAAVFIEYLGPYSSAGTARAQITRAKSSTRPWRAPGDVVVEGHVEVSEITWKAHE